MRGHLERQSVEDKARIEAAAHDREEHERQAKSGTTRAAGRLRCPPQAPPEACISRRAVFLRITSTRAFPVLAALPARRLTREHAGTILTRLINDGHGRSAAKLRSYAPTRAAWSCAVDAGSDPDIHPALHGFHVFTLTRIRSLRCRARAWRSTTVVDHTLTETELRALPESAESRTRQHSDRCPVAFVVARRPAYFASRPSNACDVDTDEQTITLYDPKGARQQPRPHRLQLTKRAVGIVERRMVQICLISLQIIIRCPRHGDYF